MSDFFLYRYNRLLMFIFYWYYRIVEKQRVCVCCGKVLNGWNNPYRKIKIEFSNRKICCLPCFYERFDI